MSELFSIQLQNRQQQGRDGIWLDLPTTTEQVQAALRQIGISSDNPQGLFISGYFAEEEKRFAIPYNMVLASNVDELNFLASRLETLSTGERAELNAALQAPQSELFSIGRITDFPENVDYSVHLPDVHGPAQLGDYYLNRSGMVDMPEEKRKAIMLYYFEGMTDVEIGKLFNTSRSTIQYRRTSSFELLKKYLEEHADEWNEW